MAIVSGVPMVGTIGNKLPRETGMHRYKRPSSEGRFIFISNALRNPAALHSRTYTCVSQITVWFS